MNLGQAVWQMIAGRHRKHDESPSTMVKRAIAEAGGVSQLAHAIGVARTTVQRWQKGAQPTEESTELLRSVLRRADMSDARARRIATRDQLTVSGLMRDGKTTRKRTIDLTPYLAGGTMGRAVEAYLRGASPYDLHVIVWAGITDRHYRWMFQPPGGIAQAGTGAVQDALGDATGAGGGGGGGGGDYEGAAYGDYGDDDYDGDLLDLVYEDYLVDANDGYEFSVGGAR